MNKIETDHLAREAIVYVRQSTQSQLRHTIGPGIVSKGRQDHRDQTDAVYGPLADATVAFEPHTEHLKTFGYALLLRSRFHGFDPADCGEVPQELADLPIVSAPARMRPAAAKRSGDRTDERSVPESCIDIRGQIAKADP